VIAKGLVEGNTAQAEFIFFFEDKCFHGAMVADFAVSAYPVAVATSLPVQKGRSNNPF